MKLQKRVKAGAATLIIKVKAHRGDPAKRGGGHRSRNGTNERGEGEDLERANQ